ncbi:MAG: HEAT repeat domain-containing protein [Candidatus Coatesbacteria bacterium]
MAFVRHAWLGLVLVAGTAWAAAPFGTDLDALLGQLPSSATVSRDSVMPRIAAMGPEVVFALAARLVEPGKGDDNGARWALHGLAFFVSRPGAEAERAWYLEAVKAELAKTTWSDFNRQFLEEQLRMTGEVAAAPALAPVPTEKDIKVLERAAASATGFDRWERTDELLAAARVLAAGKRAAAAGAIYRRLLKARADEPQVRCAALEGLAAVDGTKACPDLLAALTGDAADVADCAGRVAAAAPGAAVTAWWAARIANARGSAEVRTAVLGVLAARGDAAALPAVRRTLKDSDPGVRTAALRSDAALAGAKAVPDLAAALGGPDAEAARSCLLDLPDAATAALEGTVPAAPPKVRAGLLGVLGARGSASSLPVALAYVADADAGVRRAALGVVGVLGGPDHLALLVGRLAQDADAREAAADAFGLIVKRMKDPAPAASAVLAAFRAVRPADGAGSTGGAKAALLGLLARTGGEAALAAEREALGDTDATAREAAVRALGDWPDASPLADLAMLAKTAPEPVFRVLALRGYVRLAGEAGEGDAVLVGRLRDAWAIAGRPEDRVLVLGALGKVTHPAALEMALKAMDDPAVKEEAAAAAGRIAGELILSRREVARAALDRVLAVTTSDDVKKAARASIDSIVECSDYVTAWEIAGPYVREGLDDKKLLETPFEPERDPARVTWRLLPRNEDSDPPYLLDLKYALEGEHRTGYLRTRVFVPKKTKAILEAGSDDGIKVWIDGKVVHDNNAWRGTKCADDKVPVKLPKGWCTVLVKVAQGEGDWSACIRFRNVDGGPIEGLRAEAGAAE